MKKEFKLKTLKDLRTWDLTDHGLIEDDDLAVEIKELRAEAIKWVKKLEKEKIELMKGCGEKEETEEGIILSFSDGEASIMECGKNNQYCPLCSVKISSPLEKIKWIKHFFNLTSEDLK